MERDFMGLNSKEPAVVVKEEVVEGCKESGYLKGSGVPWPLSNKVSALPHFMSFKTAVLDEKPSKVGSDHLASSGFMSVSCADVVDPTQKRHMGEVQNMHHMHHPADIKMLPFAMSNPLFKTQFSGSGQNSGAVMMKQQFLGGVTHSVIPSGGTIAGTTETWFNSKASEAPAQLTIFYAGTVSVYNDISPEKAQAIMFLAGNSCPASNPGQHRLHIPVPTAKPAAGSGVLLNQNISTPPCSALSSPMSVSSHPIGQSSGGLTNNDNTNAAKSCGISAALMTKTEPQVVASLRPVSAAIVMPSAVPQARKASLARFLEKRKERAMNSAPYSKKSDECATPDSNGIGFSATSGMGSSPVSTTKNTKEAIA